jgi:hypothetical protein
MNREFFGLSPALALVEKLRISIEDLTTPTDDRAPPFLRIDDASKVASLPFWAATSRDARRGKVVVLVLFAEDDPCAQAILEPQIKESGLSTI